MTEGEDGKMGEGDGMRDGDWEEREGGWGQSDGDWGWRLVMREKDGGRWEGGGWVLKRWWVEDWERDGRWSPWRKVSWVRTSRAPPLSCVTLGDCGEGPV